MYVCRPRNSTEEPVEDFGEGGYQIIYTWRIELYACTCILVVKTHDEVIVHLGGPGPRRR